MIIAVSTDGNKVSAHFGRCKEYTLFEVKDGTIQSKRVIPNPGHEPGFLPKYLSSLGVACIIAGGMGPRAQQLFDAASIKTVTGVSGEVDEVVKSYLAGTLSGAANVCDHDHHAGCEHHH